MVQLSPQSSADESMMNMICSCSSSSLRPRPWCAEVGVLPGRLTSPLQGRSVWRSQRLHWTWAKDALSIEHSCNRFTDCGLWCVHTSAQIRVWDKRIYFSFRSSFPRFMSHRKQTKDDGNLQKLLWSSESLHLFSLWMITIWILLWRHHDTGTSIFCFSVMRNFLQITCIDQFILLEKWGWFCRGMHLTRRSKRALIYLYNWSRVIVAHRECRKQTLK